MLCRGFGFRLTQPPRSLKRGPNARISGLGTTGARPGSTNHGPRPLQASPGDSSGACAEPKVYYVPDLIEEARRMSPDFVFTDDDDDEPIWDLEPRNIKPMTEEDLRQQQQKQAAKESSTTVAAASPPQDEASRVVSAYDPASGFREVPAGQLQQLLSTGAFELVLDVRSPQEFAAGHIEGALNTPLEELSQAVQAGKLEAHRQRPIAVICASGQRSAQATVRLTKLLGFSPKLVTNVAGGMRGLQAEASGGGTSSGSCGSGCGCGSSDGQQ